MPTSGVVQFAEEGCTIGKLMHEAELWFEEHLEEHMPDFVIFEAPIMLNPKKTRQDTLEKLYGLAGLLQMLVLRRGIPYRRAQLNSVKKCFTGNGWAKKEDMIAECVRRGWKVRDDNHADAIAIHEYGTGLAFHQGMVA